MKGIFKSISARIGCPLAARADSGGGPRPPAKRRRVAGVLTRLVATAVLVLAGITVSQPALADFTLYLDWNGPGSVTVSDSLGGSFDCSTAGCMATYANGTTVTLTPSATATSFWMWNGACSGTGVCQLTMTGNRNVQASFKYALRINVAVFSGSIAVNADQDWITSRCTLTGCTYNYPAGTSVTLTASAKTNHEFIGWDGACSGTGDCTLTMNSDQTVDANFKTLTFPLQITLLGDGSPGTVISSPSGISCPPTCTASFDNGQEVTLSTQPKTGYTFGSWGDPPCSGWGLCVVNMDSSQTVDALFEVNTTTKVSAKPAVGEARPSRHAQGDGQGRPCDQRHAPGLGHLQGRLNDIGKREPVFGRCLAVGFEPDHRHSYDHGAIFIGQHILRRFVRHRHGQGHAGAQVRASSSTRSRPSAQQFPAVATLKSGYMIVWASNAQDGNGYGVYGQRYSATGVKQGAELHISSATTGNQSMPKVAGLTAGGFVTVWQSDKQDANTSGIYAQMFSATGVKIGTEFKVNTTSAGDQTQPAIAALTGGGFVVAWSSDGQDGSGLGVYAQLYDANAKAVGKEFKVNTTTAGDQSAPTIAATKDGGFVVVWQSPDADGLGIFGQRYNATGKAVGQQFRRQQDDDQTISRCRRSRALSDGGFVVAWQSKLQDGSGLGVYAQGFTSTGAKSGGEVRVNSYTKRRSVAAAGLGLQRRRLRGAVDIEPAGWFGQGRLCAGGRQLGRAVQRRIPGQRDNLEGPVAARGRRRRPAVSSWRRGPRAIRTARSRASTTGCSWCLD